VTAPALPPIEKYPVVTLGDQVIYALQRKQLIAYQYTPLYLGTAGARHLGYGGAGGGGKSYIARAIATAVAHIWPGSTSIIFRQTEGEVLENHYQKFRQELPPKVRDASGQWVPFYTWNGRDMAFSFPNSRNSRILLGHLGSMDDVFKYQGNEYDVMIFEEATHYLWAWISWLINFRQRATVPGSIPFCVYPSNPGNIGHAWFKRLFITRDYREEEDPAEFAFVQAYLRDNDELRRRDPLYERKLNRLEEPYRSWYKDGDWEAGAGSALPMLRRMRHLIPPFEVPDHWVRFGAFDWGYAHPWTFGEYAVNEDGRLFKLQSLTGHRHMPGVIAERIHGKVDVKRLRYIDAGHDCWNERKAEGANAPAIEEQFREMGIVLRKANISRIQGLNNLRDYLAWEHQGPEGEPDDPWLVFFDNPNNRKCFEQLEGIVPDPDDPEDALKVDADEFGEGGDDFYDETRYAAASRPRRAPSQEGKRKLDAWAPEILKLEMKRKRAPDDRREDLTDRRRAFPAHPEFGDVF
jgi:phage terminase large subunit